MYDSSPAAEAGLKTRDIILSVDGQNLEIDRDEDLSQFRAMITGRSVNDELKLRYHRDGKVKQKKIKLTAAPQSVDLAEKFQLSELGVEVRELTRDVIFDYDFPIDIEGVYIYQVDRAAPAGQGNRPVC